MANIIGEIKAYHNGKIYSIADIYDGTLSDSNVKGYLKIYHNSKTCYVPLTDNQSLKQTPCFNVYHGGKQYFALQIQSATLKATISEEVAYGDTGTIKITGNAGGVKPTATIPSAYSDCLKVNSTTSSTVVVECTKYTSSKIPVTVNVAASGSYAAASTTVNVTVAKADINPTSSASSATITYNTSKSITISGNTGKGSVSVDIPSAYSDYLSTTSVSTSTVTLKCTKYTDDTIPVTINIAATSNYAAASIPVSFKTARTAISPSATVSGTITYGTYGTITISGNTGKGKVSLLVDKANYECLEFSDITTNSAKATCTKYNSSAIPVTVKIDANGNYASGTCKVNVTTAKANLTLSASSTTVTYNATKNITLNGNDDAGTVTATVTNYTDCLTVQSTTSSSVALKCTKFTSNTISVKINVAATNNYNSGTTTVNVTTAKADGVLKFDNTPSTFTLTYGQPFTFTATENLSGGKLVLSTPSDFDKAVTSSISGNSITLKCTNYNSSYDASGTNSLKFSVVSSATDNYNSKWFNYFYAKLKKADLSLSVDSDTVTYDSTCTLSISGNAGGGAVTAEVTNYTDCLTVQSTTSDSVTVKCTKFTSNKISVKISVAATNNYNAATYTVKVSTARKKLTAAQSTFTFNGSFTYDKTEKSVANYLTGYDSNYHTLSSDTKATNAGTYTVKIAPKSNNYAFSDGSTAAKSVNWSISFLRLTKPYLTDNTFTYDKQNHSPTVHDYDSNYEYQYGMMSTANAGTYPLTYTLKSVTNTAWTDGTTAPVTREWYINKRELTKPSLKDNTYTFDGDSHSPTVLNYDSNYELQAGTDTAVNAGTYSLTYSLRSTSNTSWADGSTDKVTRDWYINKLKLLVPTLSNDTYTFDGTSKAPTVNNFNSTYETQKGTASATNADTYHLTYSLKDTVNTIWNGGTANDFVRDWVINPASTGKTPYLTNSTYTYDKSQHEPTINFYDSTTMDINSTSVLKATNAGTYSITFQTKTNYVLPSGDKFISRDWVIKPISINEASLSATHLTYDGSQKGVSLQFSTANKSLVYESGNLTGTNAGAYTYSLDFKDKTNYIWTNRKNSEQLDLVWYIDKASGCIPVTSSYSEDTSVVAMATVNCGYQTSGSTWYQNTNWELVSWSVTWLGAEAGNKTWSSTSAGIIETNILNTRFKVEWTAEGDTSALLKIHALSGGQPNDNNTYEVQVNLRCFNPNFTDVNEWTEVSRFWIKGTEVSILHRQPNGTWT